MLHCPFAFVTVFNGPAGIGVAPFGAVSVMLQSTPAPTCTKPAPVSCLNTVAVNVCG